ncbi:hypothetical protein ACJX0J_028658 [Zea mays]
MNELVEVICISILIESNKCLGSHIYLLICFSDMYWNGKGLFFTEKQNSAIEGKIKCLNKLLTWPYHNNSTLLSIYIHWQDFVPWIKIIIHENNMLLRFIGKRNRRMAHNYLAGVVLKEQGYFSTCDEFLKADDVRNKLL